MNTQKRFYVHEAAHCIQSLAENHDLTDGAAMTFTHGPELNRGGGDVPSIAVNLAGPMAEIIMASGDRADTIAQALLADPLNLILQIGPMLCGHQEDFQQARNLDDRERFSAKLQLQVTAYTFLVYHSVGLLDALVDFVAARVDPERQITFMINPRSELSQLVKSTYLAHAEMLVGNALLFFNPVLREGAVAQVRDRFTDEGEIAAMLEASIAVIPGTFYPPSLGEIDALVKQTLG